MKLTYVLNAAVTATLLTTSIIRAEDNGPADWISKHSATEITEDIERDANGDILSIQRTKETLIYIKQTSIETEKPDRDGKMRTISRTTRSVDANGSSAVTTETLLPGSSALVTTSATTVEKTASGTLTTEYERDKSGNMHVKRQTNSTTLTNSGK